MDTDFERENDPFYLSKSDAVKNLIRRGYLRADHLREHLNDLADNGVAALVGSAVVYQEALLGDDPQIAAEAFNIYKDIKHFWMNQIDHLIELVTHLPTPESNEPGHIYVGQTVILNRDITWDDLMGDGDSTIVGYKGSHWIALETNDEGSVAIVSEDKKEIDFEIWVNPTWFD